MSIFPSRKCVFTLVCLALCLAGPFAHALGSGGPKYQDIALGDITFAPIPEINPATTSAISCLLAVGLTVFTHRRAKLKARRWSTTQS